MRSSQGLLREASCCPYKLEPGVREFHPPQEDSQSQKPHCSPHSHCLVSCLCCKMLHICFVGAFVISLDMGLHGTIQEADNTPTVELGNPLGALPSGKEGRQFPVTQAPSQNVHRMD